MVKILTVSEEKKLKSLTSKRGSATKLEIQVRKILKEIEDENSDKLVSLHKFLTLMSLFQDKQGKNLGKIKEKMQKIQNEKIAPELTQVHECMMICGRENLKNETYKKGFILNNSPNSKAITTSEILFQTEFYHTPISMKHVTLIRDNSGKSFLESKMVEEIESDSKIFVEKYANKLINSISEIRSLL